MDYVPTIGLEVHAELKTRTKMFCDSLNDPDEKRPNQNVCPVCLGHPGALPTINKDAVEKVIMFGLAVGGAIAPKSKFDRKNYFYPDLPKGYQISQYDEPLVEGGEVVLRKLGKKIKIRRVHLEEDAGRLQHDKENASLVDFNRAGVPLMELVTDPDIKSAEEAVLCGKSLQLLLRYLGISDADMEKGLMRIEANVSLGQWARGKWKMGTKVEVKNLNSFRAVGDAIAYELRRQEEVLSGGGDVAHETRGWDDAKRITVSQRSKEEAHDYRYFPEPDLPPFTTDVFRVAALKEQLPELPLAKLERFKAEYGLSEEQAAFLAEDLPMADFFEAAESELSYRNQDEAHAERARTAQLLLFNYLASDVRGVMNEKGAALADLNITPERLAHLVDLIADGKIMSRQAKDILKKMCETGEDPENILESEGLHTVSDAGELQRIVEEVLKEHPAAAADYKKGKAASMQFLIGKAMGKLKGRGDPSALGELFRDGLQ